ncbi:MAG: SGNH/GDSL hydrolase family protein [Candidatus Dadabacteria bacterium]|nr:MAG: SGNH/GDSL hydrolase family protein [Candidatus Dadabacteria bacterium]
MAKRISLVFLGIILGLAGAELILRVFKLAPEVAWISRGRYRLSANAILGYEPVPGLKYDGKELTFYDYRSRETNREGYRDYNHDIRKKPGTFRIAVLGDSIAMGLWIKDMHDAFPLKLEAELKKKGVSAEVLNFGVVGYNTIQEVETLREKVLKYSPDLVVLEYCLNDTERNDGYLLGILLDQEKRSEKINAARVSRLLGWSALYRFLKFRLIQPARGQRELKIKKQRVFLSIDTVDLAFKKLSELLKDSGIELLVVIFPDFTDLNNYRRHKEHSRIISLARRYNFKVLDLLEAYRACNKQNHGRPLSFDQYHPNQTGHACAARAIAEKILSFVGSKPAAG